MKKAMAAFSSSSSRGGNRGIEREVPADGQMDRWQNERRSMSSSSMPEESRASRSAGMKMEMRGA